MLVSPPLWPEILRCLKLLSQKASASSRRTRTMPEMIKVISSRRFIFFFGLSFSSSATSLSESEGASSVIADSSSGVFSSGTELSSVSADSDPSVSFPVVVGTVGLLSLSSDSSITVTFSSAVRSSAFMFSQFSVFFILEALLCNFLFGCLQYAEFRSEFQENLLFSSFGVSE